MAIPSNITLCVSSSLFLICILFIVLSYNTTYVFDRPVHSIVFPCLVAGISLLLLANFVPFIFDYDLPPENNDAISYAEVPKQPSPWLYPTGLASGKVSTKTKGLRSYTQWALLFTGCSFLSIRVELFRQTTLNEQCTSSGYEYAIPLLVSVFDYVRNQRKNRSSFETPRTAIFPKLAYSLVNGNVHYMMSAAVLALAGLALSSITSSHRSTYICPTLSHGALRMQFVKLACLLLDTLFLVSVGEFLRRKQSKGWAKSTLQPSGILLLGVVAFWVIIGIIVYLVRPEHREYLLYAVSNYYRAALAWAVLLTLLCITSLLLIPRFGILNLSFFVSFLVICLTLTRLIISEIPSYTQISIFTVAFILIALPIAGTLLLNANAMSETESASSSMNTWFFRTLLVFYAVGFVATLMPKTQLQEFPIDSLIQLGKLQHDLYLKQAKISPDLEGAVSEYKRRYKQYPPPGFDKWYEFATSRNSPIIDDFDQIASDLLPFRAISPGRLRQLTHEIATDPSSDVGAIRVRNGSARIQDGIKPTHAWMVSAAVQMMDGFVEHLPDMDILFNLNDEPRIAVPHDVMSNLRTTAESNDLLRTESPIMNEWSANRESQWDPIEPVHMKSDTLFTDHAISHIWDIVNQICPSSSKARSERAWSRHDLCLDCLQPHSLEQFVSDWMLAADICHQPDLEYLHGFFMGPASWKTSQQLVPLFSQSSIPGFGDILFPSPWNYIEKVKYEPSPEHPDMPFLEKKKALFWIGSTSEGISVNGEWQGMTRQRFMHLMNNNSANPVTILMRSGADKDYYKYQVVDGSAPKENFGLQAEVYLSDIVRCVDCQDQLQELGGTTEHINFQDHWQYRYLFDMDGAGFSGRFLSFLQSRSLPFKTGLFRQWFDSRLTPWRHFVPQDVRLHDVWSTLAYFAGITVFQDTGNAGKEASRSVVLMEAHDEEGSYIAEEGREWARKSLRKEDMEIYFFRLLLEWGRLTDGRRDQLGFDL